MGFNDSDSNSCMTECLEGAGFDDGMLIENQWNFHIIIVLLSGS